MDNMENEEQCGVCKGTGHSVCLKCHGTGKLDFNPWEAPVNISSVCDHCFGTARDPEPDLECKGSGVKLVLA